MPSRLQHANACTGLDDLAIITNRSGSDRDEGPNVVIEGIHLCDFSGSQTIDIRQGYRRGRIEQGS